MEKRTLLNSRNHPTITHNRTLVEKAADILAELIGSWIFIFKFISFRVRAI